jgi:hypothetical protein
MGGVFSDRENGDIANRDGCQSRTSGCRGPAARAAEPFHLHANGRSPDNEDGGSSTVAVFLGNPLISTAVDPLENEPGRCLPERIVMIHSGSPDRMKMDACATETTDRE